MNGAPTATRTSALGRRFDLGLAARLLLLVAAATALALSVARPGLHATTLLTSLLTLAALFEQMQRLFQSDWPASTVAFHTQVTPPQLSADADPDLLAQLLLNLLRNAAEAAMPHSKAPSVRLEAQATKAGRLTIDVTDNGPGIPADQLQDIFLPFYTTKASGTGVGLSLARQIALAHNGSLACEPVEGGGTRFRLWL